MEQLYNDPKIEAKGVNNGQVFIQSFHHENCILKKGSVIRSMLLRNNLILEVMLLLIG